MECSHWPTPTPTPTPTKWVCNPFTSVLVLVSVSVLARVNSSAYYNWTHFLSVSVSGSVSGNVNTPSMWGDLRFTCRLWMCWVMRHGYVDTGGYPVHHGDCLVALLDREHPPRVGSGGDARGVRPVSRRRRWGVARVARVTRVPRPGVRRVHEGHVHLTCTNCNHKKKYLLQLNMLNQIK